MSAPASVSIREFAKLDGCDDKLVRRALANGKLKANSEGRLDPALAGTGWRRLNRRADTGADTAQVSAPVSAPNVRSRGKATARRKVPATVEELGDVLESIADDQVGDFLANLLGGKFADTGIAEQIKENALAAKHLIAARKDAGDLIEVEVGVKAFFDAARSWRDIWAGFPTRIGPLLAADLGLETDPVVEALTTHVQEQLEQLGTPACSIPIPEK